MEKGFPHGQSDNLPKVDSFMVTQYFSKNSDYIAAEMRGLKPNFLNMLGSDRIRYIFMENVYDFKIIKTQSAPELIKKEFGTMEPKKALSKSSNISVSYLEWDIVKPDDSFLRIEKNVNDICEKSEDNDLNSLDNTLDIINYILSNGPELTKSSSSNNNVGFLEQENPLVTVKSEIESDLKHMSLTPINYCLGSTENINESPYVTPVNIKCEECPHNLIKKVVPQSITTPEQKVFKTPSTPISSKKHIDRLQKKTPSKNNAYQHIVSPVAKYIKNCPVTPLVKDIRPTKPLPATLLINKHIASPSQKISNKENIVLPSVAYKTAKSTQVINEPDEEKLPKSPWIKKLMSTLPKPVIIKHDTRQVNLVKGPFGIRQEHSYADLPLCQADVSVCTKRSAFNKPK